MAKSSAPNQEIAPGERLKPALHLVVFGPVLRIGSDHRNIGYASDGPSFLRYLKSRAESNAGKNKPRPCYVF